MEDNIFLMVPRLITHYTRPSHVEKEIMKGVSDETREGSGYGAMRQENNNEAPYPLPSKMRDY